MEEKEIWKDIDRFPNYQVSNFGRVRNTKKNYELGQCIDKTIGYVVINLYDDNGKPHRKLVHRLVGEAFIPNPENKRLINHKDCNKANNHISNLEWATDSENMIHAFENGLCEKTRIAAREQIKKLQTMPKTDLQRQIARETITKINKRPKTERQIETAKQNINSPICRERANAAHMTRHPPIRLIETGEIFRSQKELAEKLGIADSSICAYLKGRRTTCSGYHFEYVNDVGIKQDESDQFLYDFQMRAVQKAFNGCIFNGSVGSGKSRTGLFYYFKEQGGWIEGSDYTPMKNPKDLYIITTAMKRDKLEWKPELALFRMSDNPELNYYNNKIIIDSWNNIKKYADVKNAFFLFDEDKVTGDGAWVKAFLKITKCNDWIILSATAGDTWEDYLAVFLAHGFFKNKTEYRDNHVIYDPHCRNYPRIKGYRNTERLLRLRDRILIDMTFDRHTIPHHMDIFCDYDIKLYKDTVRNRWNPYTNEPITQASSLCTVLRQIVNADESRQVALLELLEEHPRAVIFYNFNFERDILLNLGYVEGTVVAEWNGFNHDEIPDSERWVYLTQYIAGNDGWNTISTDTIIFYSQNYSYKIMTQAAGRINRLNTKFIDLYYYHLKSRSGIDLAISRALKEKKKFNERKWIDSFK